MSPRPLELFDLPKLPQFRTEVISLDCARILTRGNPLRAVNFLAHLNPTRRIYTAIHEDKAGNAILGSIRQQEGERFARLTYLAPLLKTSDVDIFPLIEHLIAQAKHWHAHQIVVEIEEESPIFLPLRQSGFSIYARQRVWDLSETANATTLPSAWRHVHEQDVIAIQRLQHQVVPPLLQQLENFEHPKRGFVCKGEEMMAYIDTIYGARGIFLRPLIHPNVDDIQAKLQGMLTKSLTNRRQRPVYFCVRSYQAWLEPILEEMQASVGPRMVVMVKHLASRQRAEITIPAGADVAWSNPAAPIQPSKIKNERKP